mmetsp:Transcript_21277/g.54302  ORF Transcript_21277/g.54302 Transcript_21277/m.54302 type:complete len:445 (-) Transcript_21277:943-2277(-)
MALLCSNIHSVERNRCALGVETEILSLCPGFLQNSMTLRIKITIGDLAVIVCINIGQNPPVITDVPDALAGIDKVRVSDGPSEAGVQPLGPCPRKRAESAPHNMPQTPDRLKALLRGHLDLLLVSGPPAGGLARAVRISPHLPLGQRASGRRKFDLPNEPALTTIQEVERTLRIPSVAGGPASVAKFQITYLAEPMRVQSGSPCGFQGAESKPEMFSESLHILVDDSCPAGALARFSAQVRHVFRGVAGNLARGGSRNCGRRSVQVANGELAVDTACQPGKNVLRIHVEGETEVTDCRGELIEAQVLLIKRDQLFPHLLERLVSRFDCLQHPGELLGDSDALAPLRWTSLLLLLWRFCTRAANFRHLNNVLNLAHRIEMLPSYGAVVGLGQSLPNRTDGAVKSCPSDALAECQVLRPSAISNSKARIPALLQRAKASDNKLPKP